MIAFTPTEDSYLLGYSQFQVKSLDKNYNPSSNKLPEKIEVEISSGSESARQSIILFQIQGLLNNAQYLKNKVYQFSNENIQQLKAQNLVIKYDFLSCKIYQ